MSLDTATLKSEDREQSEKDSPKFNGDLRWIMELFYRNILKKRGVDVKHLYMGPFDWDSDVLAIGPGNVFYRRSRFEKRLKKRSCYESI